MSVHASASPSPQVTPTKPFKGAAAPASGGGGSSANAAGASTSNRSTSGLPSSPGGLPTPTQSHFDAFTSFPFDDAPNTVQPPSALLPPAMPNIEAIDLGAREFQTGPPVPPKSLRQQQQQQQQQQKITTPSIPMIPFDPARPGSDDDGSGSDGEGAGSTPARPRKRKSTVDLRNAARSAQSSSNAEAGGSEVPESARRKINIEYIEDKSKRHITFSKRKAGIMKKAYELSTLTGTQVLLLVVSESGWVYTFTTEKFKPLVKEDENGQLSDGQRLIAACLQQDVGAPPPLPDQQFAGAGASQFDASHGVEMPRRRPIASNRRVSSRGRIPTAIRVDGQVPPVPSMPPGMAQYVDPALTPTSPHRLPVTPTRGSSMQQAQQQMLAMRSGPVEYPPEMYGYDQGGIYDVYASMPGSAPPTYHYSLDYGPGGYTDAALHSSPHYTTQPDPHHLMPNQVQTTPTAMRQQQQQQHQQQQHLQQHQQQQQVGYQDDWVPRDHR